MSATGVQPDWLDDGELEQEERPAMCFYIDPATTKDEVALLRKAVMDLDENRDVLIGQTLVVTENVQVCLAPASCPEEVFFRLAACEADIRSLIKTSYRFGALLEEVDRGK